MVGLGQACRAANGKFGSGLTIRLHFLFLTEGQELGCGMWHVLVLFLCRGPWGRSIENMYERSRQIRPL
jgi:hypothetical protein